MELDDVGEKKRSLVGDGMFACFMPNMELA